ncbi:MAG: excinuclease ABC subunit UvrA [Deltaproteobacteria bacterium]|nr:excinuclease ABC subunit UvrA [Deltaproteobacteria bacterium]
MPYSPIRVQGARQNNLKNITVSVPVGAVTVVTGVAGAGKSTLAFDVLYAEGYRRYVETFSPYARQFLERLDRPEAERIEGVLPAIAIERAAPVRTSRSTVGTMTSIDDYLRPLFSRAATLHCRECGQPVQRHSPAAIFQVLVGNFTARRVFICFSRHVGDLAPEALRDILRQAGFARVLEEGRPVSLEEALLTPRDGIITVVLDRIAVDAGHRERIVDSLESATSFGAGKLEVWIEGESEPLRFSQKLHCPRCDLDYHDPTPALFSFNNPIGACTTCNGFGRTIDIDPDLVIPDPNLSLAAGCIKPFQTPAFSECQEDLLDYARRKGLPILMPWRRLEPGVRQRIWEGEGSWYGIKGFFDWLQGRRYKKQARILLSRYRRYLPCPACGGSRLKPEALLFRLGGRTFPELEQMPISEVEPFFRQWEAPAGDRATELLLGEIQGRLRYLLDVGLGYLSLGRQSRTLSGGETQRVTLATALGASLTSTLYVLGEPSVGLHPRDVARLAGVLRRLAQHGNAVLVVDNDPLIIHAADRVIDLGPGPGQAGGQVVHEGTVSGLLMERRSPTAAYLRGGLVIPAPAKRRKPGAKALRVVGARENNLQNLSVKIPLGLLVCVTGVSGSGKSTLVDQVLYRNLRREMGLPAMEPGACRGIEGARFISEAVLVDQAPLTRSSRMNAATYLRVLEPLRAAFAATRQARLLGLSRSAFSFNTAEGACPYCKGSGFELVELQFLPDVYIKCPACDGRRFRPEVLQVRCRGHTIAEVLGLPAAEVARLFADDEWVTAALQPLLEIGLGYLTLSQPAPTLSGGEAQRLKLARRLAEARKAGDLLFILDEPTAGLHPANVADLMAALQRLVEAGHSVVMVEHDMDVARAADWLIDLGPEGGAAGGRIVGEGPPEVIAELNTPTGQVLRQPGRPLSLAAEPGAEAYVPMIHRERAIVIAGAREHNLADIRVDIPRNRLVVVTGVSGSGKSTLAFDVLYAEGRARFLDCLPAYARQYIRPLSRPEVDHIEGIPPTVALEQKISRAGAMSTCGTASEVYHYLRLLFASLGTAYCPEDGTSGEAADAAGITARLVQLFAGLDVAILAPLVRKRKGHHREIIKRVARLGFKEVRLDGQIFPAAKAPDLDRYQIHDVEAVVTRIRIEPGREEAVRAQVEKALELGYGSLVAATPGRADVFFSTRLACPRCGRALPAPDPRLFTWSQKFGACPVCQGYGYIWAEEGEEAEPEICSACGGSRLRPEALAFRIGERNIADVASLPLQEAFKWVQSLGPARREVTQRIVPELVNRLRLLIELGVGYLTMDRAVNTLSTGEAQRIRIGAELASNLRGVCYVLDEPTVGLHPRDVRALLQAFAGLRGHGNTVVVVEHQAAVIRAADHVIDLGPGAGPHGGRVVAAGPPAAVARSRASATGLWLRGEAQAPERSPRPLEGAHRLTVAGARLHNLKDLTVEIPLGRLVCVTGVSGAGKSTLVRQVIFRALKARLARQPLPPYLADLQGWEQIQHVKEVDESPIGRTPRSVPATYVGVMTAIRALFAQTPEARARGYNAGRFSFNVTGGRCERCQGQGHLKVEMPLLPVVYVPCEACRGSRYNPDTLAVTFKGKSIAEVLNLTVEEALALFEVFPKVSRPLKFLADIGLGYLRLGQPSPTLSGGEAQRTKLAAELAAEPAGRTFYILDEPTTGLHMADVAKLLSVLQRLVDRGDTVVIIEHDLDVLAAADCLIDLGPEGGEEGGRLVAWGSPAEVAANPDSHTAAFLREHLEQRHRFWSSIESKDGQQRLPG